MKIKKISYPIQSLNDNRQTQHDDRPTLLLVVDRCGLPPHRRILFVEVAEPRPVALITTTAFEPPANSQWLY
eukprot:scaffold29627_cov80-Skeletonema_marinoi.AAC.3